MQNINIANYQKLKRKEKWKKRNVNKKKINKEDYKIYKL